MGAEYRLDVRLKSVAESWDPSGLDRPKIEIRAANHAIAGTERKEYLGGSRVQRDNARRDLSNPDRISEVVSYGCDFRARLLAGGERERTREEKSK
jgi:hypothetical protein